MKINRKYKFKIAQITDRDPAFLAFLDTNPELSEVLAYRRLLLRRIEEQKKGEVSASPRKKIAF